jgi:hypothetical protein
MKYLHDDVTLMITEYNLDSGSSGELYALRSRELPIFNGVDAFTWKKYDELKYKTIGYIKSWEQARTCVDALIGLIDRKTNQVEMFYNVYFIDDAHNCCDGIGQIHMRPFVKLKVISQKYYAVICVISSVIIRALRIACVTFLWKITSQLYLLHAVLAICLYLKMMSWLIKFYL